jgi:cyclophilin family peptidyl-prolyl cis-trans isomerase
VPTPTPSQEGVVRIKQYSQVPEMTIVVDNQYVATINTNKGAIVIELFPKEAPKTVNNFVFLARDGYYDGVIFHRVIPGFMIQGGDPTGTGGGGPGYNFEDEIAPSLVFDSPGLLAMANRGGGTSTNGSQFFITVVPTPHLNGAHTIFGRVVQGQEVADAIAVVAKGPGDKPLQDVVIQGVEIQETPQ